MNRRAVVLLVFLAVLCILPINLSVSYDAPTMIDGPRLTKDFIIAADTYDFVDTISNLRAPTDLGVHSSFPEEQDYDDVFDTLTEADSDTDTSTWGKTTGSGSSYRTTAANEVRLGVFSATSSGEVASIVFYGRGSSATNCKAIITDSSGNLLANGVGAAIAVSATAGTKTLTYSAGVRPIVVSGTTYWIGMIWQAAGRVYYDATTGATSRQDTTNSYASPTSPTDAGSTTETWRQMYANINEINYGVDLEVGWTAAQFSEINEELCLRGGTQDAEALKVDIWNAAGSTWVTVIADVTASVWNNVSIADYLTDASVEIRFVDARTADDVGQSTWQIEAVLLHTWSIAPETVNISQVLTMYGSINTAESLSLIVTEVLEASVTPSLAMALLISFVQIIGVAAAVSTQTAAVVMTFQAVTIASASSTAVSMTTTLNELLTLTNSAAANILTHSQYSIIINELLGMSSAISTAFDAFIGISEAIGFFDLIETMINPPIVLMLYALLPIGLSGIPTGGLEGLDIFYDLFFSANMWSYLGPMGLVVIGYLLMKKERILGLLWFIVECLFMAQYFALVSANPAYWWHIFILLLGGLFTCVYPLWDR